ncbi:MAG: C4-type zinc ribbon domain-containing protein [Kofleriaceae bacterium]
MREKLACLLQLQTTDAKVRELETAAAKLPMRLDPLRRDLAKLQGMLDVERQKLEETAQWRKQQQEQLDRDNESLRAAKNKLSASKNSKEYTAASREVDHKRKSISDREAELKKVNEATSASQAQLDARAVDVQALRDQLAADEAAIAAQVAQLSDDIKAATARDAARVSVDAGLLKTYDALTAKRGFAVSAVVKGVCQGCHMGLPPQLNNVLARMESIETCPRCGRLVYRKELLDPPAEEPGSSTAGG